MITLFSVNSVEFYTLAAVVAAAVIAVFMRPADRGEALTFLIAGMLESDPSAALPSIHIKCGDDKSIILSRRGLPPIGSDGAASLAVTVTGTGVAIEERLTPGAGQPQYDAATFLLDFLKPGRYHIVYRNTGLGLAASASLTVRPGIKIDRRLT